VKDFPPFVVCLSDDLINFLLGTPKGSLSPCIDGPMPLGNHELQALMLTWVCVPGVWSFLLVRNKPLWFQNHYLFFFFLQYPLGKNRLEQIWSPTYLLEQSCPLTLDYLPASGLLCERERNFNLFCVTVFGDHFVIINPSVSSYHRWLPQKSNI
jgi:hypothetical protein